MKITFPEMTREKAVRLVESVYGVMYWQHEKNKVMLAYPFGAKNPVVIEPNGEMSQRRGMKLTEAVKILEQYRAGVALYDRDTILTNQVRAGAMYEAITRILMDHYKNRIIRKRGWK